jgi:hypothetical protein
MTEQAILTTQFNPQVPVNTVSQFRRELLTDQMLFKLQPPLIQRFLEIQAAGMSEAVIQKLTQLRFNLPDRVMLQVNNEGPQAVLVPVDVRDQLIGGLLDKLVRTDMLAALRSRLMELEHSPKAAVSACAILLRFAIATHMVHNMLPAGRNVRYAAVDGEEIPNLPVGNGVGPDSALTASSDASAIEDDLAGKKRGELQVPYVETARKFFLPQWVCFDEQNRMLVSTISEAEADIASMQRYLSVLHVAVDLAPYLVADEEYQKKRYGILGQLVNQGRALAHYQVKEIIHTIQRRAAEHDLDRGLSLSLPYFNDQTLKVEKYEFDIIPSGRVMFVPAFVVLAVRSQGAKVAQDTRLSPSTRRQILMELGTLEQTFLR